MIYAGKRLKNIRILKERSGDYLIEDTRGYKPGDCKCVTFSVAFSGNPSSLCHNDVGFAYLHTLRPVSWNKVPAKWQQAFTGYLDRILKEAAK